MTDAKEIRRRGNLLWGIESVLPNDHPLRSRIKSFHDRLTEFMNSDQTARRDEFLARPDEASQLSDVEIDAWDIKFESLCEELEEVYQEARKRVQ